MQVETNAVDGVNEDVRFQDLPRHTGVPVDVDLWPNNICSGALRRAAGSASLPGSLRVVVPALDDTHVG